MKLKRVYNDGTIEVKKQVDAGKIKI